MNAPRFHSGRNRLRKYIAPFFLLYGTVGVVFPFLSIWLKEWGYSTAQIAFLGAIQGMSTILVSQAWGYAADIHFGRKRLLLFCALAVSALFAAFPWVHKFWAMGLLTFVFSAFSSPMSQFLHSLLLHERGGEQRFSLIRSMGSIGFIIVNLLIGAAAQQWGTAVIFPGYIVSMVLLGLSVAPIHEQSTGGSPVHELASGERMSFAQTQSTFLRSLPIRRFLMFVFIYQLSHSLSHGFTGLWIRELGGSNTLVSIAYSLAAGAEVCVFWISDRLLSGRSAVPWLIISSLVQVARWGIVWLFPNLTTVVGSNVFHAATFGLFFASAVVFINRLSPPDLRTTGQTLLSLSYFGLATVGSNLIGSIVLKYMTLHTWYGAASLMSCVAALLAFTIPHVDVSSGFRVDNPSYSSDNPQRCVE